MKNIIRNSLLLGAAALGTVTLTGCWTPPTAMPPARADANPTWLITRTSKRVGTLQPMPAGMAAQANDAPARVMSTDRSYRLINVIYKDGCIEPIKVMLPEVLETVHRNDNVIVREMSGS